MSEHWKSTPKYWCKHCSCYVRDTKLERQNHESTAKHQSSLKRFLRELHRGHEQEERNKERAQREIARLNGVVTGSSSSAGGYRAAPPSQPTAPSETQLKKQREQLAELGVAIPSDFRPEMAMAGEWTVTNTRIIEPGGASREVKTEAKASGVRKREETEEELEEEDAVRGLFKKPRRWGRDSKTMPQESDAELDVLLSGSIVPNRRPTDAGADIKDEPDSGWVKLEVKTEVKEEADIVKQEPDDSTQGLAEDVNAVKPEDADAPIKTEDDGPSGETAPAPVVFKKRKPKGLRQK